MEYLKISFDRYEVQVSGICRTMGLLKEISAWCVTGGRASFREVPLKGGGFLQFDHGCQFIMASNPLVAVQIREWELKRELSLNPVQT